VPDIVEAILDGRQPAKMTLAVLLRPFVVGWAQQEMAFGFRPGTPRSD
jgi:ABC-type sugar transport system substrate-binding protein